MKIMGYDVEQPVRWTVTTVTGIAWPIYLLAGAPAGTPGDGIQTVLYGLMGIALVRVVALIVLALAKGIEEK